MLDHGGLVAEGTADELKQLVPGGYIRLRFADSAGLTAAASALDGSARDDQALSLHVPTDGSLPPLPALLERLDRARVQIDALTVHMPDLDDVFLTLTGHPSTEMETAR